MSWLESNTRSWRLLHLYHCSQKLKVNRLRFEVNMRYLSRQSWGVISLCLSLWICGCNRAAESEQEALSNTEDTLTIWHAYRGSERAMLETHLTEFQEQTGYRVRSLHLLSAEVVAKHADLAPYAWTT